MAQLIYIGNLAAMDTNESNSSNENPSAVQGTYDNSEMFATDVNMSSNTTSGLTYSDDGPNTAPADTLTYDIGSGPTTSALDADGRFRALYRDEDGNQNYTTISVYQTQNGDTFVRLPNGLEIQELTIGQMVGDGYTSITSNVGSSATVICFVAGTLIDTPDGPRPVEDLSIGDLVSTLDHDAQAVRWHHCWRVRSTDRTAPIRIEAGALGASLPKRALMVSPQHRIMIRSPIAARMFGAAEVLVPAKKLLDTPGVQQCPPGAPVTYAHFMCDRHEIIRANGAPAETLFPGPQARAVLDAATGAPAFPTCASAPARPLTTGRQALHMSARHLQNAKALITASR